MTVKSNTQVEFQRNLTWERSWPKWFLALLATVEILLALALLATEILNIITDFWHTNVFGGAWASIILIINWILIFATVCCKTTIRASTYSFVWNFITLATSATLIVFDIIFILNPYTCILTPTCSTQSEIISINVVAQGFPQFKNYTIYNSKQLLLEIQVGCAGVAFLTNMIYIIVFLVCRLQLRKRTIIDNPAATIIPQQRGLRIAQAPPVLPTYPHNLISYTPY